MHPGLLAATQMGGWETVKTYGWLPLIYDQAVVPLMQKIYFFSI